MLDVPTHWHRLRYLLLRLVVIPCPVKGLCLIVPQVRLLLLRLWWRLCVNDWVSVKFI